MKHGWLHKLNNEIKLLSADVRKKIIDLTQL